MIMKKQGLKVRLLTPRQAGLIVTGSPNDAIVNPETYINLHNLQLDPDEKIIFPSFYEIAPSGNVATFLRGRSDITGAILARDFNAELYENFIDVDAIFSANPAIVSNPDQMQWIADYAITMVVGEGMRDKLTLCASILYPLGQKNISIQMINQGAFQISIMIGTKRQDAEEVIRTIYQTFFN